MSCVKNAARKSRKMDKVVENVQSAKRTFHRKMFALCVCDNDMSYLEFSRATFSLFKSISSINFLILHNTNLIIEYNLEWIKLKSYLHNAKARRRK